MFLMIVINYNALRVLPYEYKVDGSTRGSIWRGDRSTEKDADEGTNMYRDIPTITQAKKHNRNTNNDVHKWPQNQTCKRT